MTCLLHPIAPVHANLYQLYFKIDELIDSKLTLFPLLNKRTALWPYSGRGDKNNRDSFFFSCSGELQYQNDGSIIRSYIKKC